MFHTFLDQPQWHIFLLCTLGLILALFLAAKRRRVRNWAYVVGAVTPLAWLVVPLLSAVLAHGNVRLEVIWCTAGEWSCYLEEFVRFFSRLSLFNPLWYMVPLTFLYLLFLLFLRKGVIAKRDDQSGVDAPARSAAADGQESKLEDNITYKLVFKYRMIMWATFGFYLLMLAWMVPSAFLTSKANFEAVHANLGDVREAIDDMGVDANRLELLESALNQQALAGLSAQNSELLTALERIETSLATDKETQESMETAVENVNQALESSVAALEKLGQEVGALAADEISAETAVELSEAVTTVTAAKDSVLAEVTTLIEAAETAENSELTESATGIKERLEGDVSNTLSALGAGAAAYAAAEESEQEAKLTEVQEQATALTAAVGSAQEPAEESLMATADGLAAMEMEAPLPNEFSGAALPHLLSTIRQMQLLALDLEAQIEETEAAQETTAETEEKDQIVAWRINELQDKVRALSAAASGISFDFATPFLMIALLFLVFLLLPWLQYLSFIMRKREEIVPDRVELLQDSGLSRRLLASLEVSNDPTLSSIAVALKKGAVDQLNSQDSRTAELYIQHVDKYEDSEEKEEEEADYEALKRVGDGEAIKKQTFYSREYLVPLLILSALTLVGWYYVIFPTAMNGLVDLLETGASIEALTKHLTQFTPLTMAFAGAWLFMTVTLTYRWVNNDLYPRTYFYAAMRLVYSFLVGLVFVAVTSNASDSLEKVIILPLAFFAGAFPLEYVRALSQWVQNRGKNKSQEAQVIKYFEIPEWGSRQPLTKLEGMTIWDDTRFYEEGMQNVHALATADMLRLALRMPYTAQKLVDWVDQAILRIHTKTLWHPGMSAVTIRRASSLIDNCSDAKTKKRSAEKIKGVVESFNAAQLMSIGADSPRVKAYDGAAELEKAAKGLSEQTTKVKEADKALVAGDEAARDNIVKLRGQVDGLEGKASSAETARDAVEKLLRDDAGDWAEGGDLQKQLHGLSSGSPTLLKSAEDGLDSSKLTSKKLEDKEDGVEESLTAAKEALKNVKLQLYPDGKDDSKKLVEKALKAMPAVDEEDESKKKIGSKSAAVVTAFVELLEATVGAKAKGESLTAESKDEAKTAVASLLSAAISARDAAKGLREAAADGSEVKSQARLLEAKLGTGDDSLVKKIETAKSSVEADLSDESKITKAKSDVKGAVDVVGLDYAADSVAALVQKLGKEDDVKVAMTRSTAEYAKKQIDALADEVKSVNDLAQSIKGDDATTWDNVKGLGKLVSDLPSKIEAVEKARTDLNSLMGGLAAQETLALREAIRKVEALSTDEATKASEAAKDLLVEVADDETVSYKLTAEKHDGLDDAKGKVTAAVTAIETVVSGANEAAEESMRSALPIRLTEGILQIMLDSLEKAPNIHYVRSFWDAQQRKAIADTRV